MEGDSFCLRSGCHEGTRADLEQLTEGRYALNPHSSAHGEQDCTTCHKAHREQVMVCTSCHEEATVPEGWLSAEEGQELAKAQGLRQKGTSGV